MGREGGGGREMEGEGGGETEMEREVDAIPCVCLQFEYCSW